MLIYKAFICEIEDIGSLECGEKTIIKEIFANDLKEAEYLAKKKVEKMRNHLFKAYVLESVTRNTKLSLRERYRRAATP